jgi:hypothetical protein
MKMKRWQFLLVSVFIVTVVLMIGSEKYFSLVRQERLEEMRQIQEENEQLLRRARQAQEQIKIMDERLVELETMLLNLERMQRIVNGVDAGAGFEAAPLSSLSSRGGRETLTAVTMPATMPSGFSAAKFERAFAGTGLEGIGEALVAAEAEHGINALLLAGVIVHETGWGSSRLAREKNNLGGIGAYDGNEYECGFTFDSRTGSIMFLARLIAVDYAPGGKFFGGSHDAEGIGVRYASDPRWAQKVAGCMRLILQRAEVAEL